jgi:protocatechuate 3,4-dioxygenase alpha subunit
MSAGYTPSQTIGPFFHDALLDEDRSELVSPDHPSAIRIVGAVYDGAGDVVPDAMVEIWQANAAGRYHDPEDDREHLPLDEGFTGFGRSGTVDGGFSFVTVKPGVGPGPGGTTQAPHVMVSIFARGLLKRLVTRIYFPDEPDANAADPVLSSIDDPRLRDTLIARDEGGGIFRFDVRLQGEGQTAFFEL